MGCIISKDCKDCSFNTFCSDSDSAKRSKNKKNNTIKSDNKMARKPSLEPKNKVIQIRVTEDVNNQFNKLCEEKYKETVSSVGNMLIKKFLVYNNGKSRR